MFESDADRLALIRALGGVVFDGPKGRFDAIFERAAVAQGDLAVISTTPQLTARTVDLERCGVQSGSLVRGTPGVFIVREPKPDGDGMTVAELELP
jgi:hypothetical protein